MAWCSASSTSACATGRLDECGLTLQEMAKLRESFIPVLTAIFHVRAPYPEAPKRVVRESDVRRDS